MENDKLHGQLKEFGEDGKPDGIVVYEEGKNVGGYAIDSEGKVTRYMKFEKGKSVFEEYYFPTGAIRMLQFKNVDEGG
eukprot:CAMPEP_0202966474 /NCGR_PEP_ID=MMETSP1396-20130829/10895_1 /ASSEMBLY_ACC=CAM_ASM_000872 /TAXON_ID= /ORGANISM="Pseudokeronopsis sp., Strain Brazil" /LENGTH=77 /DNA_ID=CAMNT_0049690363 /DNA_START=778 /DNA_END=1011 /DNA_ORIENTATION=+